MIKVRMGVLFRRAQNTEILHLATARDVDNGVGVTHAGRSRLPLHYMNSFEDFDFIQKRECVFLGESNH